MAFVVLAVLNYGLKQVSREYVKKLPEKYREFADAYRRFMQRIIRGHRYFGFISLMVFLLHAGLVLFFYSVISVTGLVTGLVLIATVCLGAYGYFVNRNHRSWWVSVHRGCAFVLVFSALIHLFYKLYY
mgnify:FL=1